MAPELKLSTIAFLEEVPVFASFEDVPDFTRYVDVPKDWYLFVSDIRGSTKATEEGRYKDVNVVGASAVMAVGILVFFLNKADAAGNAIIETQGALVIAAITLLLMGIALRFTGRKGVPASRRAA